ncbi:DNAH6 [Symbiodinium natans]|uniref:DNAH6 protein n=1 Tax=Symbiodinium natans TaxID=878477 RepID=A0A812QC89_9DINO|nr:DNAH6 [Symbiodinium natans]
MASTGTPLSRARSNLDFVTRKDLDNVLSGPVPWYVKTLFEGILKSTSPGVDAESWQQMSELLRADVDLISKLQAFEPEDSDKHRIRDILHAELEVTSLRSEFMAQFSPACVLLLRWCHALGDACGCPPPTFPMTEEHLQDAQEKAQEAREERERMAREKTEKLRSEAKVLETPASPVSEEPKGRLQLQSVLSGEVFATLKGALPAWTYKDIADRMRPLLPSDVGTITLFAGEAMEPMEHYTATLESLGVLDDSQEGQIQYTVDTAEAFLETAGKRLDLPNGSDELQGELRRMLTEATRSLDYLSKADVAEVRALNKPPRAIQLVMEAVALLMAHPFDSWKSLRAMMDDKLFLTKLLQLDAHRVSPEVLAQVHWYIANPDLLPGQVKNISRAAASLCSWTRGVYDVAVIVSRYRALQAA